MPSIKLYGRRWHFSSDIVAVPAGLSGFFHAAWIIILVVWASVKDGWPQHCASSEGLQYVAVFSGLLFTFAVKLALDILLVYHSLQGAPFEMGKRQWVVPLLYASTLPLVATLGFTVFGTHVCTRLEPDCWPVGERNAVTNLAQGLVFSSWGFMSFAAVGIAMTYNMYPQHHDLSSWEARCECIGSLLCCRKNLLRRPDGKRPPLTNIAELTAGLLSHCDLDATDITTALLLAAAAQNRRRRLRVAKALLPVYKALHNTVAGSAADAPSANDDGSDTDADETASAASSIYDVPTDRKVDFIVAERQRSLEQDQQQQHRAAPEPAGPSGNQETIVNTATPSQPPAPARRGTAVSWAQDVFDPEPGRAARQRTQTCGPRVAASGQVSQAISSIGTPPLEPTQGEPREGSLQSAFAGTAPAAYAASGVVAEQAASLALTEANVAMLDQQAALMEECASPGSSQVQAAAQMVAGDFLSVLPEGISDQHADVLNQLASAIEEEIEQLGGGQHVLADAVLEVAKEESLDLSALEVNPEAPSIWFSTASSRKAASASDRLSSIGARQDHGSVVAELGHFKGREADIAPAGAKDELADKSPFFTSGGALSDTSSQNAREDDQPTEGVIRAAAIEAAAALAAPPAEQGRHSSTKHADESEAAADVSGSMGAGASSPLDGRAAALPAAHAPLPPADEAASAAVAEVAAAAASSSSPKSGPAATGSAGSEAALEGEGVDLERQITVRFPVVITPSAHVEDFRGTLSPAALADIYAGRHDKVPSSVLKDAMHFLKYSYAVYSLKPKIENPASGLDVACCAWLYTTPNPQQVVFKGLSELEELDDDGSVELLHLNCSNRVMSHLPYMICLDHLKKAVVLSVRGTISAADIVTDAIVYPEPLDTWLPESIKEELSEPAFAHAGMVAAAKAIFQDMTERGILQQLVQDEQVGDFTAPQPQHAKRGGREDLMQSSQYDADAGSAAAEAGQYRLGGMTITDTTATSRHSEHAGQQQMRESQPSNDDRAAGSGRVGKHAPEGQQIGMREAHNAAPDFSHHSVRQHRVPGHSDSQEADGNGERSPGRQVGEIMRQKIEDESWQFIVSGHSLGAGAAALVSLKLLETYPGLKCIAYSCPGGLVSKNLAHAMAHFTTTVAVGKDAVPRSTVGNLTRLMDEMVTALARCKQPKLKVLFFPWWRQGKVHFAELFHAYDAIPPEPLEVLHRYYESRSSLGQPISMFPPGKVIFLRPIKTRRSKEWDAVWVEPEDLIAEGLLLSPHMLRDHLCSAAYEALLAAATRTELLERERRQDGVAAEASASRRVHARGAPRRVPPPFTHRKRWQQQLQARQRAGSLQQVLIEAS